jgi:hypothetical protein
MRMSHPGLTSCKELEMGDDHPPFRSTFQVRLPKEGQKEQSKRMNRKYWSSPTKSLVYLQQDSISRLGSLKYKVARHRNDRSGFLKSARKSKSIFRLRDLQYTRRIPSHSDSCSSPSQNNPSPSPYLLPLQLHPSAAEENT